MQSSLRRSLLRQPLVRRRAAAAVRAGMPEYVRVGGARTAMNQAEAVVLDEALPSMGLLSIDFLKMDVQGFEGHVAKGLRETLRRSPKLTVLMEFWPGGLSQAGSDALAPLQLFRGLGFTICRLLGRGGLARIDDHHALIREDPGWSYASLLMLGPEAPAQPSTGAASRGLR